MSFAQIFPVPAAMRDNAEFEGDLIAQTSQAALDQGLRPTGTLSLTWLEANCSEIDGFAVDDRTMLRVELSVTAE